MSEIQTHTQITKDIQLDFLRAPYSNRYGNSINYVAPLVRAIRENGVSDKEVFLNLALTDSLNDIYTQIVEHPLSETVGRYEYTLPWDKTTYPWRLKVGYRTLDEMYKEGFENRSGQIPDFEIPRNRINFNNYEELRLGRQRGETRTYLEFSPSPDLNDHSKKRGYFGNDTIFLYIHENGTEKIIQTWLPATSFDDYGNLLKDLGIKVDQNDLNSLSIMTASNFVEPDKLGKVIDFMEARIKRLEEVRVGIIEEHAKTFVWANVKKEFVELLKSAADELNKGKDISGYLSQISETMAVLQFGFRKFIHDVMKNQTGLAYGQSGNFSEFSQLDKCSQLELMLKEGYTMTACGVSEQFGSLGKANSMTNPGTEPMPTPDRPDAVKCDLCGKVLKYVKNGDSSTYDQNLKCCGKSYGC